MKPTEQQSDIIGHGGNSVIIAAPGSGKTFVISEKIKLIFDTLEEYQGVIAISYTNKASNELQSRCLTKGINPKSSFFGTIDRFFIGEIIIPFGKHIFGLPNREIQIIKSDRLPKDEQKTLEWLQRNLKLDHLSAEQLDMLVYYFRNGIILIESIGLLANYVFNKSIACKKYFLAKYKYIFIDEYQDSGANQHDIFLAINALGIVGVAVGDLNQSIYAFSGKSSVFLDNLSSNPDFRVFKLDKNHRCHPSIINYTNYLLDPSTELLPSDTNQVYFKRVEGAEVEITKYIDGVVTSIKSKFEISKNKDIAVLVRGTRTLDLIDKNLQTPHKVFVTTDLDLSLNVWSSLFARLLYFAFDANVRFIEVIEEFKPAEKIVRNDIKRLLELKRAAIGEFAKAALDKQAVIDCFIAIAKIIAPNAENEESISLLDQVISDDALLSTFRPATSEEITVMTIHKSKGLEFDFVFHLDLYEYVLPQKGPGPDKDWNNPIYTNWTQDINLHYVAISRARKACLLINSTKRTNSGGKIIDARDSEFLSKDNIQDIRYKNKNT
ncbi:DNA helicase-2 / ATP-dependent DNA helicase PcrA [Chitinophaga costaii]|uniref:DNA 3'-5' helicase n=1 Tax=Chitinophaga costaii TaxID=1335309 RepID=A0A1C3YQI0_9BACT|nr:ATP-dependent helicase [Chitinophaga costaii]PUZ30055.1 ATP-dependent helicase [Chitinophaga costaii]SCB72321.1 DNA helicase-2 / ATP-dependent DNA helicase PcrA [Chitinophaga costaii]